MASRSKQQIDWIILSIYLALVFIGWTMIYTVGYGKGYEGNFFEFLKNPVGKQLIWVVMALVVMFLAYLIDGKFWRTFANIIYIACMVLLGLVLVLGKEINGATAWFDFGGGVTIQPSEFAKFGTIIALASYLGAYANNLKSLKSQLYAFSFFLVPMALLLLQPDAGSALVFLSLQLVLFREGLPGIILAVEVCAGAVLVAGLVTPPVQLIMVLAAIGVFVLVWNTKKRPYWFSAFVILATAGIIGVQYDEAMLVLAGALCILFGLGIYQWLKKNRRQATLVLGVFIIASALGSVANIGFNTLPRHQQERILVWLKPAEADPQGAAYNLNHSKMAIASGGLTGKGFLEGTFTQGNFVPEQTTDFIFCAVGEEQGFIGVIFIISLYIGLMMRIVFLAERQRTDFNRLYAYGVASVLFLHFFINIGMTMGLMPIIGIPLPFLSKGGSSLLAFSIMIGVLLKLDAEK
ncbi:MAG: rod shape-determining protein RodA [Saprospiraceae bacterium]|nr:rod shape-determining protein RodA [Saprospiraceae bacterium]MCF8249486.1 rod shape-determining protein RodA [Saprospiraceae bacterium]MCF8280110.1 rod shape-determining protein RodA [Bacteroidales bacterium]MCF8310704.1 rod shape-determining protein RodA [Saprospiraceae bacterium]MCF8439465.1 rod shape-determining protein RodA [Saprospiraceae bacterium]